MNKIRNSIPIILMIICCCLSLRMLAINSIKDSREVFSVLSFLFITLLNIFLFFKNYSLINLAINSIRVVTLTVLKNLEISLDLSKNSEKLILKDFDYLAGELSLDFNLLLNYLVQLANNLSYWQIVMLMIPGGLLISTQAPLVVSGSWFGEVPLLKTLGGVGSIKAKDVILPPLKEALGTKVKINELAKVSPFALLEQKRISMGYFTKPTFSQNLNLTVLDKAFAVYKQDPPLYNSMLKYYPEYFENQVIKAYVDNYYKALISNKAEAMHEMVKKDFPEIESKELDLLISSVEMRKILAAGFEISKTSISQDMIYELFSTDKNIYAQIKSFYKGGASNIYHLLHQSAQNIYYDYKIISKEKLEIANIFRGEYDGNFKMKNGGECIIEIKGGGENKSIKSRVDAVLDYYSKNDLFASNNCEKIVVLTVPEKSSEDLAKIQVVNQDYAAGMLSQRKISFRLEVIKF